MLTFILAVGLITKILFVTRNTSRSRRRLTSYYSCLNCQNLLNIQPSLHTSPLVSFLSKTCVAGYKKDLLNYVLKKVYLLRNCSYCFSDTWNQKLSLSVVKQTLSSTVRVPQRRTVEPCISYKLRRSKKSDKYGSFTRTTNILNT